ncbi:MAG TPA: glycine betaine ABC transporter substrate-binding protein, partial [Thermomicrobiales bacterium]|nr:glycine betaine ABC transporter substrate-binding protein [Thermomicrobiales bacterium]
MNRISRRTLIQGTAAGAAIAAFGIGNHAFAADNPKVTVGSTNYTEQFILAEMLGFLLKDEGYDVTTEHNIGGTFVIHEARNHGDIDVHVEYTGSALTILGKDVSEVREEGDSPAEVADKVYEVVKNDYEDEWNAIWLDPLGMNNTYALAMRRAQAEDLGIEKISDLDGHAGDLVLGASQEFLAREDGLPGVEDLYGISFKDAHGMESGLMYQALDNEDVDVISAFATDGRIPAMDFVLLEDDKGFFPPYYGCPVVRGELIEKAPETKDILNQLAGMLDNET